MPLTSTQQFIDIAGIQEGIVLLKNGAYRLILSASAINFSLKSEEEQNSLIFQYQSFLNSLHFPIQIVMRSQKLDLNPYLKKINERKEQQTNELLRFQTEDYVDFISQLINLANIMKKSFYVVVPYDPINLGGGSIVNKIFKKKEPASGIKVSEDEFKRYKEELVQRANTIASGLGSMGIRCVQLTTEEIIELFYKVYNPEIAEKERFSDVNEITSNVVADAKEKAQITEEGQNKTTIEEETVIDNTSLVEEQKKKDTQLKDREAMKEGEKQVAGTPGQKPVPTQTVTPVATVPAAQPADQLTPTATTVPAPIPATPPGQPVGNVSKPINEKVGQVNNPAAATFGQAPPVAPAEPPTQKN